MTFDPHDPESKGARIAEICAALPPLPHVIRYFDDYEGIERSVMGFGECGTLKIECDGRKHSYDLHLFQENITIFLHVVADWFSRMAARSSGLEVGLEDVEDLVADLERSFAAAFSRPGDACGQ